MNLKIPIILILVLGIIIVGVAYVQIKTDKDIVPDWFENSLNTDSDDSPVYDEPDVKRTAGGGFSSGESSGSGSSGGGSSGEGVSCSYKSVPYSVSDLQSSVLCEDECVLNCRVNVRNLGVAEADFDLYFRVVNSSGSVEDEILLSQTIGDGEEYEFESEVSVSGEDYSCSYYAETPTYCV